MHSETTISTTDTATAASSSAARLQQLKAGLQPLYRRLAEHPLYRSFERLEDLHIFMQAHGFAVWDFMCLLKALQRGLTCVQVPWVPSADPESRRLINEIVLGEESDEYQGRSLSHFELYLQAMRDCGASTAAIEEFLRQIAHGAPVTHALVSSAAPPAAQAFVQQTFRFLHTNQLHVIAAAFTFGREDLIPDVFRGFLSDLEARLGKQVSLFRWYLDRHIEVDGDHHGPLALSMVANLCGDDEQKWRQAADAAAAAVTARIALWDAIAASLGAG